MHALSTFFLCALPLAAFAGQSHRGARYYYERKLHGTRSNSGSTCTKPPSSNSTYKLADLYQGSNFFEGWNFFTGNDPTHGNVKFVSQKDAQSQGLAVVHSDNTTVISVDDTTTVPKGGIRNSVRISSKKSYSSGLFIADFGAMPAGCGIWPAWWSAGPNWPMSGEVDIVEGINNQKSNQYTLHSGSSNGTCTLDKSATEDFTSNVLGTQCQSSNGHNSGCGFSDPDPTSFGQGFNNVSGGIFAHLWNNQGIKMWHFARNKIPSDITAKKPNPASWPTPAAAWSSKTCDISNHFFDHALTIDTTVCGDWAGDAYASSGCPGTCSDLVADPKNFVDAKWKINYIAVYQ
jgi:hypothetical protein